ncbi:hypothetical protein [Xanthobacter sp. 126]|uniref:hypothetical protein n=1 Tax=Xanthobacter sp. 126 TaxID=1131814 RepID=UPI0012DFD03A|nr:hypothetical protein [Xanthobacter sp. 126]
MDYSTLKDFAGPAATVIGAAIAALAALLAWRMALKQLNVTALPHLIKERDHIRARIPADDRALTLAGMTHGLLQDFESPGDIPAEIAKRFKVEPGAPLIERIIEQVVPDCDGEVCKKLINCMYDLTYRIVETDPEAAMEEFFQFMRKRNIEDQRLLTEIEKRIDTIIRGDI